MTHVFLILVVALTAYAWAHAVVNMIFETGLKLPFADGFGRKRKVARAGLIKLLDKVEHGIHTGGVAIRPIVGSEAFADVSCLEYSGEKFVGNADAGVGLSVF